MRTITIITGASMLLAEFGLHFPSEFKVCSAGKDRITIDGGWGWIAICHDKEGHIYFEDEELAQIHKLVANPKFFFVEYLEEHEVNYAIKNLKLDDVLIANDFSLIETLVNLKLLINEGKPWLQVGHKLTPK